MVNRLVMIRLLVGSPLPGNLTSSSQLQARQFFLGSTVYIKSPFYNTKVKYNNYGAQNEKRSPIPYHTLPHPEVTL